MVHLLGEYHAKLDVKGRVQLPTALQKQLGDEAMAQGFVLNRDVFERCLVLYPQSSWSVVSQKMAKLNRFVRKNAEFVRRFTAGATPLECDSSARLNLPKPLMAYAGLEKEVVFVASGDRVELWAKSVYEAMLNADYDFSALSEEVMGGLEEGGANE